MFIKVHMATRQTIRHGLMLLWFADLMNVTEEVTIVTSSVSAVSMNSIAFCLRMRKNEVLPIRRHSASVFSAPSRVFEKKAENLKFKIWFTDDQNVQETTNFEG